MNFSKLWKTVEDQEARHVAVHEAEKVRHDLATQQQQL